MNLDSAEGALIGQAQAGSTAAFSRLVDMHQQAVRAFLRRLSGNWADADDVAQDVFLAAWERIRRFERTRSFRAWLFGMAYKKYLANRRAFFRKSKRERDSGRGPESEFSSQALADARIDLMKAMNELPPEQRAAIALCLAADFSHAEAAEALGIPLGTVKSHVQRGRVKLLQILGDQ